MYTIASIGVILLNKFNSIQFISVLTFRTIEPMDGCSWADLAVLFVVCLPGGVGL